MVFRELLPSLKNDVSGHCPFCFRIPSWSNHLFWKQAAGYSHVSNTMIGLGAVNSMLEKAVSCRVFLPVGLAFDSDERSSLYSGPSLKS